LACGGRVSDLTPLRSGPGVTWGQNPAGSERAERRRSWVRSARGSFGHPRGVELIGTRISSARRVTFDGRGPGPADLPTAATWPTSHAAGATADLDGQPSIKPTRRHSWADLLQRVFEVDALCCPNRSTNEAPTRVDSRGGT